VIPATAPVVTLAQIPVQTQIVAPAVAQLPTIVRAPAVAQIPEAIQTQAVVQTTASISQQFSQLMGKINILQGQIRRQQADQVKQMDRIRNVL
jgi:TolA-binding protein